MFEAAVGSLQLFRLIQIQSDKIAPGAKVLQILTSFALSSIMKITCCNALFAVMALTQMFLGQATVIVEGDVSISMNYPNGEPDVITTGLF
jgi:hypothetical protein